MWSPLPNAYARLRSHPGQPGTLHEGRDAPSEHLLQIIWQQQRLHRDRLKTTTGQPVFILHPGFLSREGGPDFRNAVIQIGDNATCTGDIEVDPRPTDWLQHKHQVNPAFQNVVLHVVWQTPNSRNPSRLPLLELAPFLDAPVNELTALLHPEAASPPAPFVTGKCAAPLEHIGPHPLEDLLQQAALFRLRARAEQFRARARAAGWTQALWEGAFRALGYKHNPWPMLRLAELRPRWHHPPASHTELLARLLGVAGLLPTDLPGTRAGRSPYLRQLWDCWWRDRDAFADCLLPAKAWRLAGTRPSNHPQRRLALAAHWLTQGELAGQLRTWCDTDHADTQLPESLRTMLKPGADAFWSRHYTLRSKATPKPVPLLGMDRTTDLAANVVLPWLWAQASQGRRIPVCQEVERRYLAWPAGADNAVLKLARQRLLGNRRVPLPHRLWVQQGLQQVKVDYCYRANSLCDRCPFPQVARQFAEC
ncbi:MAG: DUF2851 family protein [Verrucomicrobia bacterium]|jgi:hypothetical protein|nr:DUF2851 family protein [Verrucomicrobiota bacterium]